MTGREAKEAKEVAARAEREAAAQADWAQRAVMAGMVETEEAGAAARRKSAQTILSDTHRSKTFR